MTNRVLIYSIHRMEHWWKAVGEHLGHDGAVVLTDRRGAGDRSVTDDFYRAYRAHRRSKATASSQAPGVSPGRSGTPSRRARDRSRR